MTELSITSTSEVNPGLKVRAAWAMKTIAFVALLAASSCYIDPYLAYVATSWVIFGLLGLSLDLVWGRAGVLSLGQTALYGIGGYFGSVAAINFASLTGNTLIWSVPVGMLAGLGASSLIGWLIFYGRLGPLQATILSYTFTLLLWTGSISFNARVGIAAIGGDNGLAEIPGFVVSFGKGAEALGPNGMLLCTIVLAGTVYLAVRALMRSPFGLMVDCTRLNAEKTELLGYDIRLIQLATFAVAGGIAGMAGALYASWANYLTPSVFSVQEALLVPIYVLVGGRGTLIGPFVGALLIGGLSFWLGGGVIGGQTTLVLGLCLIVLVLYLDGGIVGSAGRLLSRRKTATLKEGRTGREGTERSQLDLRAIAYHCGSHCPHVNGTLTTDAITKRFGGITPLNQVSLKFQPGKVNCLIGPNGAGKSTFLRCCIGSHIVDEGEIYLSGERATAWKKFRRVRAGLGIKMQSPQVFDDLDVFNNLWFAAYSLTRSPSAASQSATEILGLLGMTSRATLPARELAHGEQQWLDIGMVLCLRPSMILLDEPAAGMTRDERNVLSELIRELAKFAMVVVVEHDMEFIRTLDADVIVLHQGELFARGSIDELRQDERVLDVYLGRRKHVRSL